MRQTVLVTGANGFVGQHLCKELLSRGYRVRAAVRSSTTQLPLHDRCEVYRTGDLSDFSAWHDLLRGVDGVVHLIARTHVVDEFGDAAIESYRSLNVDVTGRLADAARTMEVRRFVFMSSIKAVGNGAESEYHESTPCAPEDSYGISKLEAEQCVADVLVDRSYAILRPPLVYGPGVKGNFLRLLKLVRRGIPLPSVQNHRSMVHVENLVDATICCLSNPTNGVFHIADPQPISTADLVRNMALGFQKKAFLIPMPGRLATQLGRIAGRSEELKRITGSLTVSIDRIRELCGWVPVVETPEGVQRVASAFATSPWDLQPEQAAPSRRRAA